MGFNSLRCSFPVAGWRP